MGSIQRLITTLLILASFLLVNTCQEVVDTKDNLPLTDDPDGWTLTWQDEFDGDSVDIDAWIIADGHWSHNGELQYYAPDEVYIHEDGLRLRSRYRPYYGQEFTSGHIESTYYQRYGRIDIRAKMPGTRGLWPALWLLPASRGWPPEIDILELLGHEPNTVHMSNHWGPLRDGKSPGELGQTRTAGFSAPDFTAAFHVFSMEWSSDSLKWYVDDTLRFVSTSGIPHEPMYLIMNTAIGGHWPGSPDGTTTFPQYHDIDYVRFYERNEEN